MDLDDIRKLIREELNKNLPDLSKVADKSISFLKNQGIISEVYGIGSYFFPIKDRNPNDVDFVIKLNIPFEDKKVYVFSDKLEEIKEKFMYGGETLLNVFVVDEKGRRLNSVDLWFIKHNGENLNSNIEERKNQIYWTNIKKL